MSVQTQTAILTGANMRGDREPYDFYPTPTAATEALIKAEGSHLLTRRVWEPACGDGAMAEVLKARGVKVLATDLIDRGYGVGDIDFLAAEPPERARLNAVVTNPPYKIGTGFVQRALSFPSVEYVAMLLRVNFWNAASRINLFDSWPPALVYMLTWRLDFTGKGAPTGDSMWVVWDRARGTDTRFKMLPKPKEVSQ